MIGKLFWLRPVAGVLKVKRVTGEKECERRVIERTGGVGSAKE